ncbi:MAG: hypothetical protein NVSMB51_04010 [Solirubrobacteraceae bacterium]
MLVDVHQHLWSEALVAALAVRRDVPCVRRASGTTTLHLAREAPAPLDLASEAPAARAELIAADGLDRALIALSSPLGIEALPRAEAAPLIDAYLVGAAALPAQFRPWGPFALDEAGPADVDGLLNGGCVGVSIPAGALGEADVWRKLGAVLSRIEERGAALFVHPGPGRGGGVAWPDSASRPTWWQPLTGYVAEMQAAWLHFVTAGRPEFPRLQVVFAMLAGGAPLLSERLEARDGPAIDLRDPHTWYDSSSYGPAAVGATAARVGARQLLYGSDRPVIEPVDSGCDDALKRAGAWLLA